MYNSPYLTQKREKFLEQAFLMSSTNPWLQNECNEETSLDDIIVADYSNARIKQPLSATASYVFGNQWISLGEISMIEDVFPGVIKITTPSIASGQIQPTIGSAIDWELKTCSLIGKFRQVDSTLAIFYSKINSVHEYKAVSVLYSAIDQWTKNENFYSCNVLIKEIDLKSLDSFYICSLARYLFPFNDELKYWKTFLDKARKELSEKGEEPDILLVGLS